MKTPEKRTIGEQHIKIVVGSPQKPLRRSFEIVNGYYNDSEVEFNASLLRLREILEMSINERDVDAFTFCLASIISHPICSTKTSLRRKLILVVEQVNSEYLSWYQFNETMEMLKYHVFSKDANALFAIEKMRA
jgi:hypothetical protein